MIHNKKVRLLGATGVALAAALILVPCDAFAKEAPGATVPLTRQDFPEPLLGSLRTALGAYEAVRSDLAADRLEVLPASASALAGALRLALEAQTGMAGEVPGVIEAVAQAAESLAQAGDLPVAREAFGEVSRRLLLLAGSDPRLTEGWHVFACPMVETFAKWIQPTEALENPYMGPAMPKCGFATDWSVPAPPAADALASTEKTETAKASRPEPEFKPGIPGLKMVDVRDHKFLWREIDELQIWERGERLTVKEYRNKAIEKTAHFLELEGAAADEFVAAASEAVASVREAFFNRKSNPDGQTSGTEGQFRSDVETVTTRLASLLQEEPRHQLFAPGCKKWLLKLAFGPSERKEAREAKVARESGQA